MLREQNPSCVLAFIFLPEQVRQKIFPSVGLTSDLKCGGSSTPQGPRSGFSSGGANANALA